MTPQPSLLDLGCSSGYLLEDLRAAFPDAALSGVDIVFSGLHRVSTNGSNAGVIQADATLLPLAKQSMDAVVSANLLEHVPRDDLALTEILRILKPGARAVFVVPAAPGTFDYYDRFLHHQRRYANGELAAKAVTAGFEVVRDFHIGSIIFPPFWLVKKLNRLKYRSLSGEALERRVATNIANTSNSRVGGVTVAIERYLLAHSIRLPFGIRGVTVVRRPEATP